MALLMLRVAARPEDDEHTFGHGKAEYFSSGIEGALIFVAAVGIGVTAGQRLFSPKPLEQIGLGLAVSVAASAINLVVALVILRAGRRHKSITLEANAHHLLTDVWTSVGVLVAVGVVAVTGWNRADPLIALVVAANIVWTAVSIVKRSVAGLMDAAIPAEEVSRIQAVIRSLETEGVRFADLRTRQSGARKFISLEVLVPKEWTVEKGHELADRVEEEICKTLPDSTVFTHLGPCRAPVEQARFSTEDR